MLKRIVMLHKLSICVLFLWLIFSRFSGNNWDQGHHLHPDERFLTMVTNSIKYPKTLTEYFDSNISLMNPHNVGHTYYVYGTLPVFLVKSAADFLKLNSYDGIPSVGRFISGVVDVGIAFLVGYLTWLVSKQKNVAILATGIYGLMVLPIQMAHFFTVDPYLVFFSMITICLVFTPTGMVTKKKLFILFAIAGLSFGAAIASKISALLILPMLSVYFLKLLIQSKFSAKYFLACSIFLITSFASVRLFQPYLFSGPSVFNVSINPKTIANWEELNKLYSPKTYGDSGPVYFPPATAFLGVKPYVFPLQNIIFFGLGAPLALVVFASLVLSASKFAKDIFRKTVTLESILLFGVVTIFIAQGGQFANYMRYFYILYPLLAVITAIVASNLIRGYKIMMTALLLILLVWPLAFMSIYFTKHTRVAASEWIYRNIPSGSFITSEHWDDPLPLNLPYQYSSQYTFLELPMYVGDTAFKWQEINEKITKADYVIISSNRQYGSLTGIKDRYPQTTKFYLDLFSGEGSFVKVAEFVSRPRLKFPNVSMCIFLPQVSYGKVALSTHECDEDGISFVDDYADESFTVYDHPKVTIFKKI